MHRGAKLGHYPVQVEGSLGVHRYAGQTHEQWRKRGSGDFTGAYCASSHPDLHLRLHELAIRPHRHRRGCL